MNHRSDFLLFIPATAPNLRAVLSYFSATVKVNLEGDVTLSDDTIQGLGTTQRFLHSLFGSLFLVARTPPLSSIPSDYTASSDMLEVDAISAVPHPAISQTLPPLVAEAQEGGWQGFMTMLISFGLHPGYFVAGGLAGIVSRTSTAPLDRLKVYLIAQTDVTKDAVDAAKSGNIFRAAADAWRPLAAATKELWQAGGMRSLYAGESAASLVTNGSNIF